MGNSQSDANEEAAFNIIKWIPGLNLAYAPIRAAVYAGKGDNERVVDSALGTFGPGLRPAVEIVQKTINDANHKFTTLDEVLKEAQPGDLLEFNRGWFCHYALYLGNGRVMNPGAQSKDASNTPIGDCEASHACEGNPTRISNHDDIAWKKFGVTPKSREDIVKGAKAYAAQNPTAPYEFLFRNCEYYCTLWRFGKGFSTQIINPSTTPKAGFADQLVPPVARVGYDMGMVIKYRDFNESWTV